MFARPVIFGLLTTVNIKIIVCDTHQMFLWKGTTVFGRTYCGHLQGAAIFCSEVGGSRVRQDIGAMLTYYIIAF
jgi:Cft2 family RNA processing exonuclease